MLEGADHIVHVSNKDDVIMKIDRLAGAVFANPDKLNATLAAYQDEHIYKRHRFPPCIIQHAVWLYYCCTSYAPKRVVRALKHA